MAEPPKEEKKPAESPETKGWLYKWTNYIKVLYYRFKYVTGSSRVIKSGGLFFRMGCSPTTGTRLRWLTHAGGIKFFLLII